MEQHVVTNTPELGGALVVRARQSQNVLLVEPAAAATGEAGRGPHPPTTTTAEQAALIERVWPSVRAANATAPVRDRVADKALVLVTAPGRPLVRDGDWGAVVQRAASAEQYAGEIEALCASAEMGPGGGAGDGPGPPVSPDPGSLAQFVQESVSAVTGWPHEDAGRRPSGTFFERGMDSPTAVRLMRVLRRGLRCPEVGLSTVYCNPTVSQLTCAILAAIEGGPEGDGRATAESL